MPTLPQPLTLTTHSSCLHYLHVGKGKPVLLIHGSLCDYRYWTPQINVLHRQFELLVPSLPGYWPDALTSESPRFTMAAHVDAMHALLSHAARNQPVHVVGHSRGAQVAVELALAQPQSVATLTLCDPGFPFTDEPPTGSFHLQAVQQLRAGDTEQAMRHFVDAVNGNKVWDRMAPWFKTMVLDNAFTLLSQWREMDRAIDPDHVRYIDCPVHLISGANSPSRYASRAARLTELIWNIDQSVIAMASHGMNLANPKQFNEVLARFISQA